MTTDPSSSNATPLEEDKKTVLESGNYEAWRKEMKDILTSQELWDVVTGDRYERPNDATDLATWSNDRKRRYRTAQNENAQALMLIQRAVGEQIMKEVHVKLQEKISAKKPKGSDQERQSAERFQKERFKEPRMVELAATSKDVWDTIGNLYGRSSSNINEENQKATAEESKKLKMKWIHVDTSQNEQELEEGTKSSLFEYAMRGEWDKVKEIYTRKAAAHCAKITNSSDTALHIAVIDGEYDIAEQLVNLMSFEEARSALLVKNELGDTPLHLAAFVGNAKLCGCIASKVYERISTAKKNHENSENEEVKSDQKTSDEIEAERDILVEENKEEREYILLVECNKENEAPLFVAVAQGKTDAFLCLHSYALPKQLISYYRGNKGGDTILHVAVSGEYFDLAFQIIHLYPDLVNMVNERGMSPLHCLARRSTAFRSGYRLRPHCSIIYHFKPFPKLKGTIVDQLKIKRVWDKESRMQSDSTNLPSQNRNNHRCPDNYETCFHFFTLARAFFSITDKFIGQEKLPTTSHDTNNCGHPIQSMISWLKKAFGGGNEADSGSAGESRLVPPNYGTIFELLKLGSKTMLVILGLGSSEIRKIRVKKEKHIWSIQVLDKLLEKNTLYMYERSGSGGGRPNDLTNSSISDASKQDEGKLEITYKMGKTDTPLLMAARNGITEIMEKILDKYSFAIHDLNSQKKNVVLLAVQYRQTHVYQFLIKRWKKNKVPDRVFRQVDDQGNSAKHHAATMIKDYKPWRIPGAALQMQWEIKWYKFVKSSMRQNFFPLFNHRSETPKEMFSKSHQDLVKSGGEWLTSTSQSCSVVAALIATVAFATSSTVPGGNEEKTGTPILENQIAFKVFAITSLIALCFSITSVIMFLAILTSRYEAKDFGNDLPIKVLLGLTSLFVSIAAILVCFCAGHFFVLSDELKFATFPLYGVACLPVTFFAIAQLPLYIDLIKATLTTVPQRRYVVIVAEKNDNSSPQSDNANQPSSNKSISDKNEDRHLTKQQAGDKTSPNQKTNEDT